MRKDVRTGREVSIIFDYRVCWTKGTEKPSWQRPGILCFVPHLRHTRKEMHIPIHTQVCVPLSWKIHFDLSQINLYCFSTGIFNKKFGVNEYHCTAKINNCKYLSQWSINRHLPRILWGNRDDILTSIQLRNDAFIHRAAYHSKRISLLIKKIAQDSYLSTTYLSSTPFFHDRRRAPLSIKKNSWGSWKVYKSGNSPGEKKKRKNLVKGFEVCVIQLYQE